MRLRRSGDPTGPIDDAAFAAAMDAFAPFESRPRVAVAVSGGPDSIALALLLDRWARASGGSVLALTVDHGLRPESTAEAERVGLWLSARRIAHATLAWAGPKPTSGIQQAARRARYALLAEACAQRGILHLAIAHHADDQAETVLFRATRGSGPVGLAGMTTSRSLGPVRLIRPLLAWPKAALIATCEAAGQEFTEDPSNRSPRFARTALRADIAVDPERRMDLLATSHHAGLDRGVTEDRLVRLLARLAEARPDGAVIVDLAGTDAEAGPQILSATLRAVGGGEHPPDRHAVAELARSVGVADFRGASLAGCLVQRFRGRLLVAREPGRVAPPAELTPGQWGLWDGRFRLRLDPSAVGRFEVGALGRPRYAALRRRIKAAKPALIAETLPAISAGNRLIAVPGLGWSEADAPAVDQQLATLWPLAPERFTVVYPAARIICHTEDARAESDRLS